MLHITGIANRSLPVPKKKVIKRKKEVKLEIRSYGGNQINLWDP
jgi:hypothetical protein